jgi:predicted ribosome quality control (RQC) complex YloA/Tae2 family protein
MEQFKKYRKCISPTGTVIVCGKNAEQNESLVKKFIGKENIIMHTAKPGSPFCVILKKPKRGDLKQTAIFCARYSQAWKKPRIKKDVEVHMFGGKDVYKDREMKTGTFGVKKRKKIIVKKEELRE